MRVVIVYESMYGNTHVVADAIGAGLEPAADVIVVPVSKANPELLNDAALVVVGGPTHVHGMSRATTRKGAAEAAQKPDSGLALEPGALGPGLRDWLGTLGRCSAKAAAFDTRATGPAALTGRASKGIARELRRHDFDMAAEPESFIVTKDNHLIVGETARARAWGAQLAARIAPERAQSGRS
jgi:hypothetical protein